LARKNQEEKNQEEKKPGGMNHGHGDKQI
jgi:hypothetical protein